MTNDNDGCKGNAGLPITEARFCPIGKIKLELTPAENAGFLFYQENSRAFRVEKVKAGKTKT
jgi:hypothetical protein